VLDFKELGGEGSRTPVSYRYVRQDPGKALSERIQREYAVMEMPGWRWMLLVLLLGGQHLEPPWGATLSDIAKPASLYAER
jgi:hypothetical protein